MLGTSGNVLGLYLDEPIYDLGTSGTIWDGPIIIAKKLEKLHKKRKNFRRLKQPDTLGKIKFYNHQKSIKLVPKIIPQTKKTPDA